MNMCSLVELELPLLNLNKEERGKRKEERGKSKEQRQKTKVESRKTKDKRAKTSQNISVYKCVIKRVIPRIV